MLAIQNLSAEYYRRGKVISAVRDVSLTVNRGETVGLVGESGSGKSTLALSILRLIGSQEGKITKGKILFNDGVDLLALPEEAMRDIRGRQISMIFQDPFTSLNPVMRIDEQMGEVLTAHRMDSGSGPLREALEHVQLDTDRVLKSYPHQLSGGQRQRVLIATAILTKPQFLLADEPTTALDVLVQKDILELLFRLQKEMNMGMLFISHNLGLVAQYTQRIAVMKDGRLVEEGLSTEIFRNPQHSYTRDLIAALPRLTKSK